MAQVSSQSSAGQPTNNPANKSNPRPIPVQSTTAPIPDRRTSPTTTTGKSGPNPPILVHSAHPPPAQSIPPARHPPPQHLAQQQLKSFPSTSIGRALAQLITIGGQSEDSCAHKRGTSVLCGPTEVSQRRTISHVVRMPMLEQSANHMSFIDQSGNPSPICQPYANPKPILQSNANTRPLCRRFINPAWQCQSIANSPIQFKPWTNPPIQGQTDDPGPAHQFNQRQSHIPRQQIRQYVANPSI